MKIGFLTAVKALSRMLAALTALSFGVFGQSVAAQSDSWASEILEDAQCGQSNFGFDQRKLEEWLDSDDLLSLWIAMMSYSKEGCEEVLSKFFKGLTSDPRYLDFDIEKSEFDGRDVYHIDRGLFESARLFLSRPGSYEPSFALVQELARRSVDGDREAMKALIEFAFQSQFQIESLERQDFRPVQEELLKQLRIVFPEGDFDDPTYRTDTDRWIERQIATYSSPSSNTKSDSWLASIGVNTGFLSGESGNNALTIESYLRNQRLVSVTDYHGALYSLALSFMAGETSEQVSQDDEIAFALLSKDETNVLVYDELMSFYDSGRSTPVDPKKAAQFGLASLLHGLGPSGPNMANFTYGGLSKETIKQLQERLAMFGYYTSTVDGIVGPNFINAVLTLKKECAAREVIVGDEIVEFVEEGKWCL